MIEIGDPPQLGGMHSSSSSFKKKIKILANQKFPYDFFKIKKSHNLIFHMKLDHEDGLFFKDLKNLPRGHQLIRSINHSKSRTAGLNINHNTDNN
jgi:hypothetical protein